VRQPLKILPFYLTRIVLDGLSIPFFNLGINVSRTVSLSNTLTSRSRSFPDWILNVNRIPATPQEPTSEVANVAVHGATSPVDSGKDTPTSILQQERVYNGKDVELPSNILAPLQIPEIESSPVLEERIVDETGSKTMAVHFP